MLIGLSLPSPPQNMLCRKDVVLTAKAAVSAVAVTVEDVFAPVLAALTQSNSLIIVDPVNP
jgi:hypothetical protein